MKQLNDGIAKLPYSGTGKAVGAVEKATKKIKKVSKKRPPQKL